MDKKITTDNRGNSTQRKRGVKQKMTDPNTTLKELELSNIDKEQLDQIFFNVPSAPIIKDTVSVIANSKNLKDIETNRKKATKDSKKIYKVENDTSGDKKIVYAYNRKGLNYSIGLANFSTYFKDDTNKGLMKIFVFVLIQIFEQCFIDRKFIELPPGEKICAFISYEKMVEAGLYTSKHIAKDNFELNLDKLTSIKITGERYGKERPGGDRIGLFDAKEEEGGYSLILNDLIDWNAIAKFYTIMPKWIFKLSSTAFQMAFYIFYLARQNAKKISETHSFTISLRALKGQLNLPDETETRETKKLIKQPIEKAIEEINDEAKTKDFRISLTPKFKGNESIKYYLDTGKLKVKITGSYFSTFKKIDMKAKRKIETSEKKQSKA